MASDGNDETSGYGDWRCAGLADDHDVASDRDTGGLCSKRLHPDLEGNDRRRMMRLKRRADTEALKRARVIEERRTAKMASATSVQELEESMDTETGASSSAAALMSAAEAVLAETRETLKSLTVSALQQTHAMIHRTDTTAEEFFQAHKDILGSKPARNSLTSWRA